MIYKPIKEWGAYPGFLKELEIRRFYLTVPSPMNEGKGVAFIQR
jgi:hypothetical protein